MNLTDVQITTERLYLEPVTSNYREDIFREFTPEITRMMYPAPAKDISETDAYIQKTRDELAAGTDISFAVLQKDTKEYLGQAGLHKINTRTPEFGVWIKKSAHGNGYGKEAVTAIKNWCDEYLDADYYLYPAADKNIGSINIAEALGGTVQREYDEKNMSGYIQHLLEYHIPTKKGSK